MIRIMLSLIFVAAACEVNHATDSTAQPEPPKERPATQTETSKERSGMLSTPQALGGSARQWTVLITVNALNPGDDDWFYDQDCDNDLAETTRRQALFARRLDEALAGVLSKNPHCAIASVAPMAFGQNGCGDEGAASQPSGAYVVFSCPNGEPLSLTASAPPAPSK